MNETRGNLEVRGYVHTGNRDLTPEEKAGIKREGLVRILISVVLWLLFVPCLFAMLAGLVMLTEAQGHDTDKWTARLAIGAVALEVIGALTQGRRGRNLRGDAKSGIVNVYEWHQVSARQLPQYQWNQTPVTRLEVLPGSERVWNVNGTPLKNGWDALRSNLLLDRLGLRAIK